jgi:hypothetical protein
MSHNDPARMDRLYNRALRIRERRTGGLWMPIIWHLALRGHTDAMIDLAAWFSHDNGSTSLGTPADGFSAAGLYRRAFRKGDARAAQHMAMAHFNRNNMLGYRHWLRLGANAGDTEAAEQIEYFETRLWHGAAHDIGRGRPEQRRDGFE